MSKLKETQPILVSNESIEHGVKLTLKVQSSLDYFEGHFPELPILAGVVQLDWAVKFANEYLGLSSAVVKQVEVLKFQEMIRADQVVDLSLTRKSDYKFLFKYVSDIGVHASGRIVLEEA